MGAEVNLPFLRRSSSWDQYSATTVQYQAGSDLSKISSSDNKRRSLRRRAARLRRPQSLRSMEWNQFTS
jgi:hypothetical protein